MVKVSYGIHCVLCVYIGKYMDRTVHFFISIYPSLFLPSPLSPSLLLMLSSLAEYADLHGKLPEKRVWNVLLDLTQVWVGWAWPSEGYVLSESNT